MLLFPQFKHGGSPVVFTKRRDLAGARFGRLLVQSFVSKNVDRKAQWHCICDCGGSLVTAGSNLTRGRTRSCGCLRREKTSERFSGAAASSRIYLEHPAEYLAYKDLVRRCTNQRRKDYPRYGGRGISVSDRWLNGDGVKSGLECFIEDMGPRPGLGYSIDRIDNDGDYSAQNCRWATVLEQARNRRKPNNPTKPPA